MYILPRINMAEIFKKYIFIIEKSLLLLEYYLLLKKL